MAQRVVTILTDDLDGSESADVETVAFGFDGASYEIDLNKKNRGAFEKAITPYLNASRKSGRASSTRAKRGAGAKRTDLNEIREWARKNGHEVSERGRIAQSVLDAYDAR